MQYVVSDGIVINTINNKFAVLYSGAYRYKWNSWKKEHIKTTLFFSPLILYLIKGGKSRDLVNKDSDGLTTKGKEIIGDLFERLDKPHYSYEDVKYIKIKWIKLGEKIRVTEYDGYEKIECYIEDEWISPTVSCNL